MSRRNITSSLKVLPPCINCLKGLAHACIATMEGTAPVKEVTTLLKKTTLHESTPVSEGNVADIRGKNRGLEDNSWHAIKARIPDIESISLGLREIEDSYPFQLPLLTPRLKSLMVIMLIICIGRHGARKCFGGYPQNHA